MEGGRFALLWRNICKVLIASLLLSGVSGCVLPAMFSDEPKRFKSKTLKQIEENKTTLAEGESILGTPDVTYEYANATCYSWREHVADFALPGPGGCCSPILSFTSLILFFNEDGILVTKEKRSDPCPIWRPSGARPGVGDEGLKNCVIYAFSEKYSTAQLLIDGVASLRDDYITDWKGGYSVFSTKPGQHEIQYLGRTQEERENYSWPEGRPPPEAQELSQRGDPINIRCQAGEAVVIKVEDEKRQGHRVKKLMIKDSLDGRGELLALEGEHN